MSAYVVANYRVTDPDRFAEYPNAAVATVLAHGGEFVIADSESQPIEGDPGHATVVIRFRDKHSAQAWLDAPEYQAIAPLRRATSQGTVVLVEGAPDNVAIPEE